MPVEKKGFEGQEYVLPPNMTFRLKILRNKKKQNKFFFFVLDVQKQNRTVLFHICAFSWEIEKEG